jgi:hypothetical protein
MDMFWSTARPTERLLVRLVAAWVVAGILLAAFWEVLLAALWLYALGFWVSYLLAGMALSVLAIRHRRVAGSRARALTLAATVPAVVIALWYGAGVLRAGGNALAAWVRGT